MADHEASVRVDMRRGSFEASGSTEFVERMLDVLPSLLSVAPMSDDGDERDDNGPREAGGDFGAFLQQRQITKKTSQARATLAFIYYVTKIRRETCTTEDIVKCYEDAGLPVPANLRATLNNLKNRDKYISSPTTGTYVLTVPGQNIVTQNMG